MKILLILFSLLCVLHGAPADTSKNDTNENPPEVVVENVPVEEAAANVELEDPVPVVENVSDTTENPPNAEEENVPVEEAAASVELEDPLQVVETYYYPYNNPTFVNPRPPLPYYNPVYPNPPYNPYYGNYVHQNPIANFLNFGLNTVKNFVGLGLQAALGPFAPSPYRPYNRHPFGYNYIGKSEQVEIIEDETRSQMTPLIQCLKREWGIENVRKCYTKSTRTELIYEPLEQEEDGDGRKCWATPVRVNKGMLEYCFDLPGQKRVTARFISNLFF